MWMLNVSHHSADGRVNPARRKPSNARLITDVGSVEPELLVRNAVLPKQGFIPDSISTGRPTHGDFNVTKYLT